MNDTVEESTEASIRITLFPLAGLVRWIFYIHRCEIVQPIKSQFFYYILSPFIGSDVTSDIVAFNSAEYNIARDALVS